MISLLVWLSFFYKTYADTKDNNEDIHNIFLINSYDTDNKWENRVKLGLKESIKDNSNINLK